MILTKLVSCLPNLVQLPPPTLTWIGISSFQALMTASAFASQTGMAPTPYGKFALSKDKEEEKSSGLKVSGMQNMLLIYVPALLYLAGLVLPADIKMLRFGDMNMRGTLIAGLLTFHFAKRVFETLFLHKYATRVSPFLGIFIGLYYTFVSYIIISAQTLVDTSVLYPITELVGLIMFCLGEVGNLVHHYLLSTLRSSSNSDSKETSINEVIKKQYKVPRGLLFEYVATPHYLFELMSWLGIAIMSQQLNAFLVFTSMSSYLIGRSVAQNKFNKDNIDGYPKHRKNIFPFVF